MSSLFDKFKALVNASVRGSRRSLRESGGPVETTEPGAPNPQLTQVPPAEESLNRAASPITESPLPGIEQLDQHNDQAETIEEERVADLLKRGKPQG